MLPDPDPFDGNTGFDIIEFSMRDGNDTINLNSVGSYQGDVRSYVFDLGEGDDDANVNGANTDVLFGTSLDFEFDCDGGNDDVNFALGDFLSSTLTVEANGETHSDDFNFVLGDIDANFVSFAEENGIGHGSVVDIDMDFSSGSIDTLTTILGAVGYGSEVSYDAKGGSGNDRMGMIFNGVIDGTLIVNVSLDSGNDILDVQLNEEFGLGSQQIYIPTDNVQTVTQISHAEARFNLNGNDGNDTMTVRAGEQQGPVERIAAGFSLGQDVYVAYGAFLDVRLMGGYGDDKTTLDFSTKAGLDLQGGFKLRMDGSHGKDTLLVRLYLAWCSTGEVDGDMRGGNDADKVYLYLDDNNDIVWVPDAPALVPFPIGGVTYGPSGFFLQDGGSQTDKGFTRYNGDVLLAGETAGTPIYRRNIETILSVDPIPPV